MKKFTVEVEWVATAEVTVEAANANDAKRIVAGRLQGRSLYQVVDMRGFLKHRGERVTTAMENAVEDDE